MHRIETEHKLMVVRGFEAGVKGSNCLMDAGFPFSGDQDVLELDRGSGCAIPLNYSL